LFFLYGTELAVVYLMAAVTFSLPANYVGGYKNKVFRER
jgi:hypothetical protein